MYYKIKPFTQGFKITKRFYARFAVLVCENCFRRCIFIMLLSRAVTIENNCKLNINYLPFFLLKYPKI